MPGERKVYTGCQNGGVYTDCGCLISELIINQIKGHELGQGHTATASRSAGVPHNLLPQSGMEMLSRDKRT